MLDDISKRKDIEHLMTAFYEQATQDALLADFFNSVVVIDWDVHLPKICDFWESVLFGSSIYQGNPIAVHQALNSKKALEKIHFDRWIALFCDTVDGLYEGEKAQLAKNRAMSIAMVMQIKMHKPN